jgi:uncharacterized protein YegP (UPF0339 family)
MPTRIDAGPGDPEAGFRKGVWVMGRFQLYRDRRKEYRWRLRARNNRVIADSGEGYARKVDCKHGIALVRQMGEVEIYQDRRAAYRWRFPATNRRIIADSGEGYSRRSNCTRAVSTTRRVAADARLEDRCGGAADFAVGAGEGGAPFAVQFDGSAGGNSDRTAVAYAWDFGERWHWPPPHFGGDGSPSEGCRIGPPSC